MPLMVCNKTPLVSGEGLTYIFDQSDSSNMGHPFRFSTTSDGTHGGGSQYTTGVTTNGTPGQSGITHKLQSQTAPTLYYYCANHSGMGGQANTPAADTYGLLSWNSGQWNAQNDSGVELTGVSATSSTGDLVSYSLNGWGRNTWNSETWGDSQNPGLELTGLSLTSSVGSTEAFNEKGWGGRFWNEGEWGQVK